MFALLLASILEPITCEEALRDYFETFSEECHQLVDTPVGTLYLPDEDSLDPVPSISKFIGPKDNIAAIGNVDPQLILEAALATFGEIHIASISKGTLQVLYWDLMLNRASNITLHHKERPPLENIDFILVGPDQVGEGSAFLNFLPTSSRRPALVLPLLNGIDPLRADPFVRSVYHVRLDVLRQRGYTIEELPHGYHLAKP